MVGTGNNRQTTRHENIKSAVCRQPFRQAVLHFASNPILSFDFAAARTHLSESSPLKVPDAGEVHPSVSRLAATAQLQFSEWVKAFVKPQSVNPVLRFIAADAFALCHTLQHYMAQGFTSANLYQRQLSPERLELDAAEYAKGNVPSKFDVRDASNRSDHFVALNIIVSAGPLIKDAPWATLHTETMDQGNGGEMSKFEKLLCCQTKTVAALLGISPRVLGETSSTPSTNSG